MEWEDFLAEEITAKVYGQINEEGNVHNENKKKFDTENYLVQSQEKEHFIYLEEVTVPIEIKEQFADYMQNTLGLSYEEAFNEFGKGITLDNYNIDGYKAYVFKIETDGFHFDCIAANKVDNTVQEEESEEVEIESTISEEETVVSEKGEEETVLISTDVISVSKAAPITEVKVYDTSIAANTGIPSPQFLTFGLIASFSIGAIILLLRKIK